MQTKDHRRLFLDMQEHPENYTEAQLEAMMDELDRDPDTEQAWLEFEQQHPTNTHRPLRRWLQIAAMFIGVAIFSGIAYATIHQLRQQAEEPSPQPTVAVSNPQAEVETVAPVRFDDVRLDSILTIVAAHYGKSVCFRSEEARAMKLIMTWKPDEPLADFIDGLNMFDGLSLTLQRDTIFVETTKGKEGAE